MASLEHQLIPDSSSETEASYVAVPVPGSSWLCMGPGAVESIACWLLDEHALRMGIWPWAPLCHGAPLCSGIIICAAARTCLVLYVQNDPNRALAIAWERMCAAKMLYCPASKSEA